MDGSQTAVLTVSKLTSITEFRALVQEKMDVAPHRQRLFFRGKQLEDGHTMFDYNLNINDVIQLMVKQVLSENNTNTLKKPLMATKTSQACDKQNIQSAETPSTTTVKAESEYYCVGDLVDAKSLVDGAWWEAKIIKIVLNSNAKDRPDEDDDGFLYHVIYNNYEYEAPSEMLLKHVRPRAHKYIKLDEVKPGQVIMANYNLEDPEQRGYWFDCKVTEMVNTRTDKRLLATVYVGADASPIEGCHIHLVKELFAVEKNIKLSERSPEMERLVLEGSPSKRVSAPNCSNCKDQQRRKCRECGCHECGLKDYPEKQLMCDECDMAFHIYCIRPPLQTIPDVDEWFCHLCKNDDTEIVRAGEKLKDSKKKAKMASATSSSARDWGKGFACAGRQKVCTIVPQNHFGPVPGVEVGTQWKFRLQASEAGIHRPHVAGIHGRENEGAYSIVLSGGYEDDEDNGDSFSYTGSGGRDLSGNKRTAEQSCDQLLTRMNKALALNCNVPVNKNGAKAEDWKGGKPVRVVRNAKGRKHSKYAPEEGNRYDGIYKIVKYWQDKGKSGFMVWRYLLKRDDPTPAPWTKDGKKRMEMLGLEMQYPEGYLEAQKEKEESQGKNSESDGDEGNNKTPKSKKRKGAADKEYENNNDGEPDAKKRKSSGGYIIPKEIENLITKDTKNSKLWNECKAKILDGRTQFLNSVQEKFECICCQELVYKPVTTDCKHNVCHPCLQRSFKAEVFFCPACRYDLGREYKMDVNNPLNKLLIKLFPGYDSARH
ncbi:hypothetical protein Pmani_008578 [Petrolisthes manimaculis]|uniref:RING-type E3 ubiquitin transferase n=1 Tax=Petrolisthes manimaculis TaxID=1843537 RepID=A0AAE1Q570_9EUCA|nr:hypothetical protein Pmani_008578 [Petrolisthes manimaculis]